MRPLHARSRRSSRSPAAVRVGKQMFYRQRELPLDEAYAYAGDVMARNMMEEDAGEGIDAFLEAQADVAFVVRY